MTVELFYFTPLPNTFSIITEFVIEYIVVSYLMVTEQIVLCEFSSCT